jgi:DNA modification methylase
MHQSENSIPLLAKQINKNIQVVNTTSECVEFIYLPYYETLDDIQNNTLLFDTLNDFISRTDKNATIAILSSPIFACAFCSQLKNDVHLKLWIAVKLEETLESREYLPQQHGALLIFTRYKESIRHTKTRIGYTYCPTCEKTTKDYGGKKHLYHEFGTLISDVWRDITVDFNKYPKEIINRICDLFGLPQYKYVYVYDQREFYKSCRKNHIFMRFSQSENVFSDNSVLMLGDCIDKLRTIPENSIDFCFADPPYNLNKKYESWDDGIDIKEYFNWCDKWLSQLARVIKPGRTLAILNIPQWCIRYFKHLKTILDYQDWIVWEGLSLPVRMIMPSHYSILCFSKGKPRVLPSLDKNTEMQLEKKAIVTQMENFCMRPTCVTNRTKKGIVDKQNVTNIWYDIHRLKHNSRRVDHPCQLPPMFMYRLISLFTYENEFVLDPFNGAGTTTLAAQQLRRRYIGIEVSEYYHNMALRRHKELILGLDPFRKTNGINDNVKNSRVKRLIKQKYIVSKKILQLEIKKIAKKIGHIPSKVEVSEHSRFPIEYFENYFINWGEATAAARTTGMSEYKKNGNQTNLIPDSQLPLFDKVIGNK